MSSHVFVVSEWLPKKGYEQEVWRKFQELMKLTKSNERGCVNARVTRQIAHPGSPGKSKYTIVLLQEYVDVQAFDAHCDSIYVKEFISKYIEDENCTIIEDGRCRLFSEE